jgi:hypothetical protein
MSPDGRVPSGFEGLASARRAGNHSSAGAFGRPLNEELTESKREPLAERTAGAGVPERVAGAGIRLSQAPGPLAAGSPAARQIEPT